MAIECRCLPVGIAEIASRLGLHDSAVPKLLGEMPTPRGHVDRRPWWCWVHTIEPRLRATLPQTEAQLEAMDMVNNAVHEIDEAVEKVPGARSEEALEEAMEDVGTAYSHAVLEVLLPVRGAKRIARSEIGDMPSDYVVRESRVSWSRLPDDDELECARLVRRALAQYLCGEWW